MVIETIIMLLAMVIPVIYIAKGSDNDSEETDYERTYRFTHYPDGRVEEEDY
jgi:hypothetical protein